MFSFPHDQAYLVKIKLIRAKGRNIFIKLKHFLKLTELAKAEKVAFKNKILGLLLYQ